MAEYNLCFYHNMDTPAPCPFIWSGIKPVFGWEYSQIELAVFRTTLISIKNGPEYHQSDPEHHHSGPKYHQIGPGYHQSGPEYRQSGM